MAIVTVDELMMNFINMLVLCMKDNAIIYVDVFTNDMDYEEFDTYLAGYFTHKLADVNPEFYDELYPCIIINAMNAEDKSDVTMIGEGADGRLGLERDERGVEFIHDMEAHIIKWFESNPCGLRTLAAQ
jgi:hypothetical protein